MKNWRDEILKYFDEPVPALTIIADPDGIFGDAKILQDLRTKKVEVLAYQEPIAFRFIYESRYRDALAAASLCLVVLVQGMSDEFIPYDLLSQGRKLNFSLGNLFPRLSPVILKGLDKNELDAVAAVYEQYAGNNNDRETAEFILNRVFNLQWQAIRSQRDLMAFLMALYEQGRILPEILAIYLSEQWREQAELKDLPLQEMMGSEQFFLRYMQTEWETFIQNMQKASFQIKETMEGITQLEAEYPIADKNVRLFLDQFFAEGKLTPVRIEDSQGLPQWIEFGIICDEKASHRRRLLERIFQFSEKLHEDMSYKEWLSAALLYSEIKEQAFLLKKSSDVEIDADLWQLQLQVDRLFFDWVLREYHSLSNLPYLPEPVMVHHIPHFLAKKKREDKIALIVLDGMAMTQWLQIRTELQQQFDFQQQGVFAWLPTVTAVSRQAIFVGERPAYYGASIHTTAKEPHQWQVFWENQGILKMYVEYTCISDYPADAGSYSVSKPNNKVKGIVIGIVDQLVHASMQGNKGLYEEMKLWLDTGFLSELFGSLLSDGYQVYLTSDHGNRECVGTGKLSEGVLAHTRGERVRVYHSKTLRDQAAAVYESIPWDSSSLPANMHVLLSSVNGAFVPNGEKIVSHGGMAIEEVIVPFVRVLSKEKKAGHSYE